MLMLRGALQWAGSTAGGWVLRALRATPAAFGADSASIRAVAQRSPNFRGDAFVNVDSASIVKIDPYHLRLIGREIRACRGATRPAAPVPLAKRDVEMNVAGRPSDLAVSWFGHSTVLVEIDGYRVLTDPVWSDRVSPSDVIGPRRMHPAPVPPEALPTLDAVVISHDHFDHLDLDTVVTLARAQRASFYVPLGVGAHLRAWGIPEQRIVELDWHECARVGELTLICTPARHLSGRLRTWNTTLWASWVLTGPGHRVYFAGDTGYTSSFAKIAADHGPFDLTLMPVGGYTSALPDIHMNPEEAVRAHLDVTDSGSGLLLPIHWCTFRSAPHPWAEPIERLLVAADAAHAQVAVPQPGGRVDPAEPVGTDPWWRGVSGH
jgi:L-ascorbate metabolism protein UlaG (beta-lactamase superfamily)